MTLLSSYPELKVEFPHLLTVLQNGNCIDLDDVDNESIREGLERVFKSLELVNTDTGYSLPEGRKQETVVASLASFKCIFDSVIREKENSDETAVESHTRRD